MSDYWTAALKDTRKPQVEDTMPVGGGDAESSDGVAALIQSTNPARIAEAGKNYRRIAEMCADSVDLLHLQAGRIAETLGGEALQGIFETIGELQRDLARISFAARSVGEPLVWYGEQVLPWFHNNVPRTGDVPVDDWFYDMVGEDNNGHALARHHLRQLNRFMGDAYGAIGGYVEQRSSAPQGGMVDPSLASPTGLQPLSGVGDPYAGSGLPGTPGFTQPDLQNPAMRDPSLTDPSLTDPSLKDPSLTDPSLKDPTLENPALKDPSLEDPSSQDPDASAQSPADLKNPALDTPDLKTPEPPHIPTATDLSSLPQTAPTQTGVPQTGVPQTGTGPGAPSGTAAVTQAGGATPPGAGRAGATGMPMGMIPPMMGGAPGGQERERERARFPLVEDEAFDSDDLGGPSVVA
ncbi:hypothetical protein ITP53_47425 [Nonomuraea sp. K274]|uniref:Uncharacterized protein n=1 Tax=Nonomuraea cypriaca TaxID=1187855 RepID=A0A931F6F7_9ACTN|nr:hypothetical protein [Nonomuraea cypriaca]MBF8193178.1 hypothetical protein [Nonomuraea cypriaca]